MTGSTKSEKALRAVLVVAYAGVMVWIYTPEHTRRRFAMAATARARAALARLARAEGERAMGRELAGVEPGYNAVFVLSRARDALSALYERLHY